MSKAATASSSSPKLPGPRVAREQETIKAMMRIFCRDHHSPESTLCRDCEDLLAYALQRLQVCPFHEEKPACNRCLVHCYSKTQRQRVKSVMRYAGPRMLLRHPMLSIRHLVDKLRPTRKLAPRERR
jgi:hypothetical protein